jgi:GTP pyrophosphokinase
MFYTKGDIKSLPKEQLHFAFSIHSEIGIKTRGTRVKSSSKLWTKNGDQVEIITSQNQNLPLTGWLRYHIQSKNKIRNVLNETLKKLLKTEKRY